MSKENKVEYERVDEEGDRYKRILAKFNPHFLHDSDFEIEFIPLVYANNLGNIFVTEIDSMSTIDLFRWAIRELSLSKGIGGWERGYIPSIKENTGYAKDQVEAWRAGKSELEPQQIIGRIEGVYEVVAKNFSEPTAFALNYFLETGRLGSHPFANKDFNIGELRKVIEEFPYYSINSNGEKIIRPLVPHLFDTHQTEYAKRVILDFLGVMCMLTNMITEDITIDDIREELVKEQQNNILTLATSLEKSSGGDTTSKENKVEYERVDEEGDNYRRILAKFNPHFPRSADIEIEFIPLENAIDLGEIFVGDIDAMSTIDIYRWYVRHQSMTKGIGSWECGYIPSIKGNRSYAEDHLEFYRAGKLELEPRQIISGIKRVHEVVVDRFSEPTAFAYNQFLLSGELGSLPLDGEGFTIKRLKSVIEEFPYYSVNSNDEKVGRSLTEHLFDTHKTEYVVRAILNFLDMSCIAANEITEDITLEDIIEAMKKEIQ